MFLKGSFNMDNTQKMGGFIDEATGLLEEMKASHQRNLVTHEMHEAQLVLYRQMVTDSIDLAERRWNGMRAFILVIVGSLILAGMTGGVQISKRPTAESISDEYATKGEMLRSFGSVTNDMFHLFESEGLLTKEEVEDAIKNARTGVLREIDADYVTRSIKTVK